MGCSVRVAIRRVAGECGHIHHGAAVESQDEAGRQPESPHHRHGTCAIGSRVVITGTSSRAPLAVRAPPYTLLYY